MPFGSLVLGGIYLAMLSRSHDGCYDTKIQHEPSPHVVISGHIYVSTGFRGPEEEHEELLVTSGHVIALAEQQIYILLGMSCYCVDYLFQIPEAHATKTHLSTCRCCVYSPSSISPKRKEKSKSTEPTTQSVYRLLMTPVLCAVAKDSSAEHIKIKT